MRPPPQAPERRASRTRASRLRRSSYGPSAFKAFTSCSDESYLMDFRALASRSAARRGRSRHESANPGVNDEVAELDAPQPSCMFTRTCGINSAVECQLPKLKVAGSNPVSRSPNRLESRPVGDLVSRPFSRLPPEPHLQPHFQWARRVRWGPSAGRRRSRPASHRARRSSNGAASPP